MQATPWMRYCAVVLLGFGIDYSVVRSGKQRVEEGSQAAFGVQQYGTRPTWLRTWPDQDMWAPLMVVGLAVEWSGSFPSPMRVPAVTTLCTSSGGKGGGAGREHPATPQCAALGALRLGARSLRASSRPPRARPPPHITADDILCRTTPPTNLHSLGHGRRFCAGPRPYCEFPVRTVRGHVCEARSSASSRAFTSVATTVLLSDF